MTLESEVSKLIVERLKILCPGQNVQLTDRLYHDLEVDIEDAAELFEFVSSRFNVDVSGVNLARYFPRYVPTIRRLLEGLNLIQKKKKTEIRVVDLVRFAMGNKSALP